MRQVVVAAFGGPENLRVVHQPDPHPGVGEVRVRVRAAGLNPVDLRIAEGGEVARRFGVVPPFVNGNDFAGVVDEVGDGVSTWRVGDRVYGGARCRAQSEYLLVRDDEPLIRTPAGLSDDHAAVLDIAARTAFAAVNALELTATDTVLITAAAGGCGILACQLAAQTGARVVGTASPRNHELLRSLGVVPVDYRRPLRDAMREAGVESISALLDCHGGDSMDLALAWGVPPARINSVADREGAHRRGALSIGRAATSPQSLEPLGRMVAEGTLRVWIDRRYPVEDATDAYRTLGQGHVRGKLLLSFD